MKKLKAIVVSLCLVLALGACGKSEETYTAEELANMSEKELAEIMEQQEKEDESDKKNKPGKADEPSQEIIDAEWYSGKVQIDGVVYDLPLTISELDDLGFEYYPVQMNDQYEWERINDDYLFGEAEYIQVKYLLDDKQIFSSHIINPLEGFHTFADIINELGSAIIGVGSYSELPDELIHYYPGGLQIGDSLSLIEERLGTPSQTDSMDSVMVYQYGEGNTCSTTINVDRETQQIISISTGAVLDPSELSMESLETITFENFICPGDDSVHNFSMKMFPGASYEAGDFGGGKYRASFILNEQVYSFTMYVGVSTYLTDSYTTYILSETDDAGVTRTLDNMYQYTVSMNGYHMTGSIIVENVSNPDANYAYGNEEFTNAIYEIIRSIQLDNM